MSRLARLFGLVAALLVAASTPLAAQSIQMLNVDYVPGATYDDDRDMLDIYMPSGVTDAPVVVFFHGGALRAGDKSDGQHLAKRLVPLGIGVVAANYRLTPAVAHPAHIQDAATATAWVLDNIADYGGDPDNVYVAGHSAGAYLAALLVLDPSHLGTHHRSPASLRGSIPIAAFLYVEETAADRPKDVWGEEPAGWLTASVTPHIKEARTRMLMIYADGDADWRREQNDRFGAAMNMGRRSSVEVVEVPNRTHNGLITEMNEPDDRIGDLISRFVGAGE